MVDEELKQDTDWLKELINERLRKVFKLGLFSQIVLEDSNEKV